MPSLDSGSRRRTIAFALAAIVGLTAIGFIYLRWQESRSYAVTGDPSILATLPAMSLGSPDAPVTIAKFADFQCPACAVHEANHMPAIKANLIDTGKVRLLFFDFPIQTRHPHAELAARAARCAGDQGHFWEYHDLLFARQSEWSALEDPVDLFATMATQAGGDEEAFAECLDSRRFRREVEESVRLGRSMGVRGTPTFFVGPMRIDGGGSAAEIEALVEQTLAVTTTTQ